MNKEMVDKSALLPHRDKAKRRIVKLLNHKEALALGVTSEIRIDLADGRQPVGSFLAETIDLREGGVVLGSGGPAMVGSGRQGSL
jgi:hypothetical protein